MTKKPIVYRIQFFFLSGCACLPFKREIERLLAARMKHINRTEVCRLDGIDPVLWKRPDNKFWGRRFREGGRASVVGVLCFVRFELFLPFLLLAGKFSH
jgi:hypothetical protein